MVDGVEYHGTFGQAYIGDAAVDRLNIISANVHLPLENPVDFKYLSLFQAPPGLVSLPCVGVQLVRKQGWHEFVYAFDGKLDLSNGTLAQGEMTASLDGNDETVAIETHPKFLALVKKYGGSYNPDGSFAGFPRVQPGAKAGTINPLYGTDEYRDITWTWSVSFSAATIPPDVTRNLGCIETPDGFGDQAPPSAPGVNDWLKLAPRCQWRGNVWAITKRWQGGGRRGINRDVYQTAP